VQGLRRHSKTGPRCGVKGGMPSLSEIKNGNEADEGEWPWQVQLKSYGETFCGGTLLSPKWVLTAASCVLPRDFDVVVGAYSQRNPSARESSYGVLERFKHPQFDRTESPSPYDVAMLRLDRAVQMNENVGAACLPAADEEVAANTSCWITGWGPVLGKSIYPDILQEAELDVLSNADCMSKFGFNAIDESLMCARGEKSFWRIVDACLEDAGGPLVCERDGRWTLHGVTSRAKEGGCGDGQYPTFWTRVSKVTEWIEEFLRGGCPGCTLAPPPRCDPTLTVVPQVCPGGIPCPQCGTRRCDCPL